MNKILKYLSNEQEDWKLKNKQKITEILIEGFTIIYQILAEDMVQELKCLKVSRHYTHTHTHMYEHKHTHENIHTYALVHQLCP
jgi:hypothetical protein